MTGKDIYVDISVNGLWAGGIPEDQWDDDKTVEESETELAEWLQHELELRDDEIQTDLDYDVDIIVGEPENE